MKLNIRYLVALLIIAFVSNYSIAQLSFFSKYDTIAGNISKAIPSGDAMLIFNNYRKDVDKSKFRLTRLDECRDLSWVKEYTSEAEELYTVPDVVYTENEIYLLLTSKDPSIGDLEVVKMDLNGEPLWSKKIVSDNSTLNTYNSNILFGITSGKIKDGLFVVTNDTDGNVLIISLSFDGVILESKKLSGIHHQASVINKEGDLLIFADNGVYAKVEIVDETIDSLIWVRKLKNLEFDIFNDPISIQNNEDTSFIAAVVDNTIKVDTSVHRLIKFDNDGIILKETRGFFATDEIDYKDAVNSLKTKYVKPNEDFPTNTEPIPLYYMLRNKVFFFNTNLEKQLAPKVYKFAKDSFDVIDVSLEICDDESLVMTGFCYQIDTFGNLVFENPYMFASKTQTAEKGYKVEAEEDNCLEDSTARFFMNLLDTEIDTAALSMDTVELTLSDIELQYEFVTNVIEEKCGKINFDLTQPDPILICPTTELTEFDATNLNCAAIGYKWNGVEGESTFKTNIEGTYTVVANFCDTIRTADYVLEYEKDLNKCFEVLIPNLIFVDEITDTTGFKIFEKFKSTSDKFEYDKFSMQVFDRWGEKVFETDDPTVGWDGRYKGKPVPPGVYLYSASWEGKLNGIPMEPDGQKGQISILQ